MANVLMAADAGNGFDLLRANARINRVGKIGMAIATVGFHDASVVVVDHDGLMKVLRRKSQRMKESIATFAEPFPKEIVRCVAVVAFRDIVMRRLYPRVVVILHDVTVRAGFTF